MDKNRERFTEGNTGDLKGASRTAISGKKRSGSLHRRRLTPNLHYKVLAILLAVVLWFYAASERGIIRDRVFEEIPVAVHGLSSDLVLIGEPSPVQITLRGSVDSLNVKELTAYLDLSGIGTGETTLPVQVAVPNGITLVGVKPSRVKVQVDTRAEKQIPVEFRLSGHTAEGYTTMTPTLKPTQITIAGGKSVLGSVQQAYVNLDLRNTERSLSEMVPVKVLDREGQVVGGLKITPSNIEVFVPVVQGQPLKSVPVKAILNGTPAAGYRVVETRVEPETVNVIGLPDALTKVEQINTLPVNITDARDTIVSPVQLEIPSTIIGTEPTRVTVMVRIANGGGEREIGAIGVQVKNNPSGLTAGLSTPEVSIRIVGPPDQVEKLTARDFSAYVDLLGLGEGKNQVPVRVTGPAGITVVRVNPDSLAVTLTASVSG